MGDCNTNVCANLREPKHRPRSTPLVTQPGGKGGPVIQGFAPRRSFIVNTGSDRLILWVCPGVVISPVDEVTLSYGYDGSEMTACACERLVVPHGEYILYVSSTTNANEVRVADTGFAVTKIEPFDPMDGAINLEDELYIDNSSENNPVILYGNMALQNVKPTATGSQLTYQWYFEDKLMSGQACANLTGDSSTLESGRYHCKITYMFGDQSMLSENVYIESFSGAHTITPGKALDVYGFLKNVYGEIDPYYAPVSVVLNGDINQLASSDDNSKFVIEGDTSQIFLATEVGVSFEDEEIKLTYNSDSGEYDSSDGQSFTDYLESLYKLSESGSIVITPTNWAP